MKKKVKPIFKFLTFVAIVIVIALLLMWPPVSDRVAAMANTTGDRVRSVARTIAGIGLGVALVTWGIAAISVPVLGVAMVVIGLALLAYSVWPLFRPAPNKVEMP